MNLSEQIKQLEKERDYYRSLCIKHRIIKRSDQFHGQKQHIPISQALDYFKKTNYLELSHRWLNTCERVWKEFTDYSGEILFSDLKKKHVSDFILSQNGKLSHATRKNYLSAIKNVVRTIMEYYSEEIVSPEASPILGIKIKMTEDEIAKQKDNEDKFLEIADFTKWSEHPFTGYENYIRNISLLQCYTGLAPNEIKEFDPHQHVVNTISGQKKIRIRRKKTKNSSGNYSEIPLFPEAEKLIEFFEADIRATSGFIDIPGSYYYWLKKTSSDAKLSVQMTPHGGRYTFGYLMLMKGFSMEAISGMMGHESLETTKSRYAKITFTHIEKEYEEIKNKVYNN